MSRTLKAENISRMRIIILYDLYHLPGVTSPVILSRMIKRIKQQVSINPLQRMNLPDRIVLVGEPFILVQF